jgi:hypothetical protein
LDSGQQPSGTPCVDACDGEHVETGPQRYAETFSESEVSAGAHFPAVDVQCEAVVDCHEDVRLNGGFSERRGEIFAEGARPKRSSTARHLVRPDPLRIAKVKGRSAGNKIQRSERKQGVYN